MNKVTTSITALALTAGFSLAAIAPASADQAAVNRNEIIGGLALGFVPGLPQIELRPDVVFLFLLPPLLYPAAVSPITPMLLPDLAPPFRKSESSHSLLNGLPLRRNCRDERPPSAFRMFGRKSMESL